MSENVREIGFLELERLLAEAAHRMYMQVPAKKEIVAYPIPRGGVPVALGMQKHIQFLLTDRPEIADVFIDDLIDSGSTAESFANAFPNVPLITLLDKRTLEDSERWISFPWERSLNGADEGVEHNFRRLLEHMGEDVSRGGLLETPARAAKAWKFWTHGYNLRAQNILKVFEDGAEEYDQMVVVRDIPVYSHCEHHLAPIFGKATVGYIPNGKIVGLSKLNRLVDMYARRLQVQERLTTQVCDALMQHLQPLGAGVYVAARHMCMESRGVCQQGHETVTIALSGAMRKEPAARAEFLSTCRST